MWAYTDDLKEVTDKCQRKANLRQNFAVQLAKQVHTLHSRKANFKLCWRSSLWKAEAIPTRMRAVKDTLYSVYPIQSMEKEESVWKTYKVAIDSSF